MVKASANTAKNAAKVKLEFVAVNYENDESIEIKEEPIDTRIPFINGECTDVSPADPIHTLDSNRAVSEQNVDLSAKVAVKTLSCGQIVMETASDGLQTYRLICSHCQSTFPTTNENFWPNFVKHINEAHIPAPFVESSKTIVEPNIKQQVVDKVSTRQTTTIYENAVETNEDITAIDEFNEVVHDDDNDSFNADAEDFNDSDWEDEMFGPKRKRQKTAIKPKKAQIDKSENSNDANDKKQKQNDIISFDHPDRNCVVTFLELMTSRAILWLPRQSIMKRFDEALTELTNKFNEFFPRYALTKELARQSIKSVKDLYQRSLDNEKQKDNKSACKRRSKTSDYRLKFPEYFELCAEIEENSKNILQVCDICQTTFYSPQDLQVHKFKKHKIGELPFKCQRCFYSFATADKLASHEEKHNRVKNYKCETCGQGFYVESKLQAHMALHTDDSKQICEICGKKFPSLTKYRRHKLHHEAPKEKCEICGKLYFEKWTLSEHIKSHKNERQYRCDICGKTFNRQEGVTIHKRGVHKIKTQTKKYVWVNRVTSSMSNTENTSGSQNEEDGGGGECGGGGNSNSTSFSSTVANDETISYDVKPTLPSEGNSNCNTVTTPATNTQQNIFPLEILTSLLN